MDTPDKRGIKQRRVLLAGGGLVLALALALVLNIAGLGVIAPRDWAAALLITVVLQAAVWLILEVGWDRYLTWDPHYLYVPMVAAIICLNLYAYAAPSLRTALLMAWFAAPAFMVGLAGAAGLLAMAALMAAGYLTTISLLIARGHELSPPFELVATGIFLIINGYAAVVYERLRRERIERHQLRERLNALAITDPLTGLFNRRYFEEILRSEISRIRRYGGHCSLAMIDLDFFKHYNDALGHLAGDALLQDLAELIRGHLRASDIFARYGGEELAVIMVQAPKAEAMLAMDRLRELVEAYPFRGGDIQPHGRLTISVGVASCPEDAVDYEELVRKADRALYAAKRLGRNRVQVAVPA